MSENHEAKWFFQLNGQIQGPFTQDVMENTLQTLSEEQATQALIWKRGLAEWIKAEKWQTASSVELSTTPEAENDDFRIMDDVAADLISSEPEASSDKKINLTDLDHDLFTQSTTQSFTEGVFYRVQVNFVDQPLMTKAELMSLIAKSQDVTKISIQDPKTKDWKDVYAFPDIVERLGLSRRKQPRVPILAQFTGRSNKSDDVSYRVITISQGGMGFTENFELQIGDEVEGQVSSPHFFQSINVKAEVIYAGQDGYIGLKFTQLTDETRAAIIEYIKKFGKNSSHTPA